MGFPRGIVILGCPTIYNMKATLPYGVLSLSFNSSWVMTDFFFFQADVESASEWCWLLNFLGMKRFCDSADPAAAD